MRRGWRVISTRGNSSRVRICRYGNVLSSLRSLLNRGRRSLIIRASSNSAAMSSSVEMKSASRTRPIQSRMRTSWAASLWKYDAARLRRFFALPM